MRKLIALVLFVSGLSWAQDTKVKYFAEVGGNYDYFAKSPAQTSGFGLRIGDSNAFLVTDIDTTINAALTYATLRENIEYHVAVSGRWEFLGLGTIGVTTNGDVSVANFGGGVGVSYDFGSLVTKDKVKLPVVFKYRIQAITATQVKPTYELTFRKTF